MRLFECDSCGNLVYFENTRCEQCGADLAFNPDHLRLSVRPPQARPCDNARHDACNWLLAADAAADEIFCPACRLNRTIPDLSTPGALALWQRVEIAKHRAVYGLLRLGLTLPNRVDEPETGLAFDFLADPDPTFREVMTGHAAGLITLNIVEADPVERERQRTTMGEPFRTLLGHLRHELGHYLWDRLLAPDAARLADWRQQFGDERDDYAAALDRHYAADDDGGWRDAFVSHYAAAHPWEDWAESCAHYLHMVDTLETAWAFGLRSRPRRGPPEVATAADFDPYAEPDFDRIVEAWLPLTFAVNSLNRSMGQPDLYPFVVAPPAMDKLRHVHRVLRGVSGGCAGGGGKGCCG